MNKKKILIASGMALLVAGTILNVHDALNEFGVLDISLHPQVMAQTGGGTGYRTGTGKQGRASVECHISTSTTTTGGSSSTSTSTGSVGGGLNFGNGLWGGNITGGFTSGNSSSAGSTSSVTTTTEEKFKGTKYWCDPPVNCTPTTCYTFDPCHQ